MTVSLKYRTPGGLALAERAGRICYRSEGNTTPTSYAGFLAGMYASGHTTVLEPCRFLFHVDEHEYDVLDMLMDSPFIRVTRGYDARGKHFWVSANARSIERGVVNGTTLSGMLARAMKSQVKDIAPCLFGINHLVGDPDKLPDPVRASNTTLIGSFEPPQLLEPYDLLTHAAFTFHVGRISRTCSHQMVRHRDATFGQAQQRKGNAISMGVVIPGTIAQDMDTEDIFLGLSQLAGDTYKYLKDAGVPQEDARFALLASAETELVMTIPGHSLVNFIKLREDKHAQWEIRNVADQIKHLVPQVMEWSRICKKGAI